MQKKSKAKERIHGPARHRRRQYGWLLKFNAAVVVIRRDVKATKIILIHSRVKY